jgi:biopolymer transport protein ExbB
MLYRYVGWSQDSSTVPMTGTRNRSNRLKVTHAAPPIGFSRVLMRLKCVVLVPLVLLFVPLAVAQDASAPAPASTPPVAASILPPDLSAWGMIAHADIVVKAVIAGLVFASALTWTVALVKGIEIVLTGRRMRAELTVIRSAADLTDAERQLGATDTPCSALIQAAREEETASAGLAEKGGIKERAAWRLDRLTAAAGRNIARGVGVLATIGATAPLSGRSGP